MVAQNLIVERSLLRLAKNSVTRLHFGMNLLPFFLALFTIITLLPMRFAVAQTPDVIKQKVKDCLVRIENYPSAIVKGKYSLRGNSRGMAHLQFRDNEMWMEIDSLAIANALDKIELKAIYKAMGTSGFLYTISYDGKTFCEFNPYNLSFQIQDRKNLPIQFADCPLFPKYWTHMGSDAAQLFRKIVEPSKYETKVESLGDGKWKLSQTNLGHLLPNGNARVGIRDRYIIVDEKCDFLVIEYFGEGAQGKLAGTLLWEKQGDNWYAKEGKQTGGSQPYAQWSIESIVFDEAQCRDKFNHIEETIPFATEIRIVDEEFRTLSSRYKGDADGKKEFEARERARLEVLRSPK